MKVLKTSDIEVKERSGGLFKGRVTVQPVLEDFNMIHGALERCRGLRGTAATGHDALLLSQGVLIETVYNHGIRTTLR